MVSLGVVPSKHLRSPPRCVRWAQPAGPQKCSFERTIGHPEGRHGELMSYGLSGLLLVPRGVECDKMLHAPTSSA